MRGISRQIEEKMKESGFYPLGIEGNTEGNWILMDFGDIIIHVFQKNTREFYDLERLWGEAPRTEVDETKSLKRLFKGWVG